MSILQAFQDASDNGEGGYDLAPAFTVAAGLIEAAEAALSHDESRSFRVSAQFPATDEC